MENQEFKPIKLSMTNKT